MANEHTHVASSRQIPYSISRNVTYFFYSSDSGRSITTKKIHTHSQQTKHYTWQQGAGFIFSVNNLENVHVSTMAASPYYHKMERETNSFGKLKVGKENKSTRVLFCLNGSSLCIVIHALNDNTKPAINSPPHA